MKSILFVCTGNTCRSPMAKAICEYICRQNGLEYECDSCGITTADGLFASENAVLAVKELYSIDLSNHRSKQVSDKLVEDADTIFTMSESHAKALMYYFPDCSDKIVCAAPEISDPYMSNLEVYKLCASELYEHISALILKENTELEISKMQSSDTEKIAELEKICFSSPWSESALLEETQNENAHFLVCKKGNRVAGYIGCIFACDEGSITNVAVFPEFRKTGVASALITELCKHAQDNGVSTLFLEVRKSNFAAISLYEKCGFERVGERKNFYTAPTEDAIIMKKRFKIG